MRRGRSAWIAAAAVAGILLLAILLRPAGPAPASRGARADSTEPSLADRPGDDETRSGRREAESGRTAPSARPGAAGGGTRESPREDLLRLREAELARLQERILDERLDPMLRVQELKRLQEQAVLDASVFTPDVVAGVLRLIRSSANPTVRGHAAGGLRGASSPDFKQAMIGLLETDESAGVRRSAANALAPVNGDPVVREALSRALGKESDVHVRDEVRRSQSYVAPADLLRRSGAGERKE